MTRGNCKLCLNEAELQVSHLLPRAVYTLFRSKSPNPNPILVTSQNVLQTSNQIKAHLLCSRCEDVLNSRGERRVLPLLAKPSGEFPFFDSYYNIIRTAMLMGTPLSLQSRMQGSTLDPYPILRLESSGKPQFMTGQRTMETNRFALDVTASYLGLICLRMGYYDFPTGSCLQ